MASVDELADLLTQALDAVTQLVPVADNLNVNPAALKGLHQTLVDACASMAAIRTPDGFVVLSGSTLPIFPSWSVVAGPRGQLVGGFIMLDASQIPDTPGKITFTDQPNWQSS